MVYPPPLKLSNNHEFQLQPATLEDLPMMAELFVIAHDTEVTVFNQMKDVPRPLVYQYYTTAFTSLFQNEKGVEFRKIVEVDNNKIIGMTCWHQPSPISEQEHYPAQLPKGSDESLCEEFFGNMEIKERKWFSILGGGENFFMLHYIAISPAYQGNGIGAWAIKPKLQAADLAGKKTLLIGTPGAQRLYGRLGFEEVDSFEIGLVERGLEGEAKWAVMVRHPSGDSCS